MKEFQTDSFHARKLLHTTVFAQCFSPCGKFLVAASNYGTIAVYSLVACLSPDADDNARKPVYTFTATKEKAIYCLLSTDTLLISAGVGEICAWKWSDVLGKAAKTVWTLKIPKLQAFACPEVNSLALNNDESGSHLYSGCGDNNIYSWDIETGQETLMLSGHQDYVHSVSLKNNGRECVSASEDGSVRIWDCRSNGEAIQVIEPCKNEETARPKFGKWMGCAAADPAEDWLICGGGPKLAAWHLRSLSPMSVFNTPGACQNNIIFYEDTLISGGTEAAVNHWYMNGDLKSKVPCTPTAVFNVAINTKSESNKVLSAAGSSPYIDVCTNFGYKAFSLPFTAV